MVLRVKNIVVPLPSISEQRIILFKIEKLMQKLDEAEKAIEQSLKTSELLTKTVLAEAFKTQ